MAVTDDQLDTLKDWAREYGRDGVLNDPRDTEIVGAVFDRAEIEGMRTEDEFDAIVTPDDLPAPEDHADIVSAWEKGNAEYLNRCEACEQQRSGDPDFCLQCLQDMKRKREQATTEGAAGRATRFAETGDLTILTEGLD